MGKGKHRKRLSLSKTWKVKEKTFRIYHENLDVLDISRKIGLWSGVKARLGITG